MNPDSEELAKLISGVSESLHREMHEGFTRVTERFDLMETVWTGTAPCCKLAPAGALE
jgi:hypothetical protein